MPPLCIRSTVVPGTVDRLIKQTGKSIAFSPEYLGEQPGDPWVEELSCGFLILGGSPEICHIVAAAFAAVPGHTIEVHKTSARTAETCKYMENAFLAAKVSFVNQFYEITQALDIEFEELRRLWLLDPRIGLSHTCVTPERGFRGRCLP